MKSGADAASVASVIEKSHHDGDACAMGNPVEAGLPIPDLLACSGRGNHQPLFFALLELLNTVLYDVGGSGTVDGHHTQPPEYRSQRPEEPGVFHHDLNVDPVDEDHGQSNGKISVGCVGGGDDNVFGYIRRLSFNLPADALQEENRYQTQDGADDYRLVYRHVQIVSVEDIFPGCSGGIPFSSFRQKAGLWHAAGGSECRPKKGH